MKKNLMFGKYEVIKHIGDGSNGTVYKVRLSDQKIIRAVKELSGYVESKDSPKYKSFLEEYRTLALLGNCSHPNIVNVHAADLYENQAYFEMDYVDGISLREYVKAKPFLPMDEVYKYIHDILSATAYAHVDIYKYMFDREEDSVPTDPNNGKNVIIDEATEKRLIAKYGVKHNDIHSSNIMRNSYDGRCILLDFGISMRGDKAARLSGLKEGALEYMAPEKIMNGVVDFRTDVYSIGVVLYEILTGKVPYSLYDEGGKERTTASMLQLHAEAEIPSIENARKLAYLSSTGDAGQYEKDYPEWLEKMILKCLSKSPEKRYANAKEIFEEFKSSMSSTLNDNNENKAKAILLDDIKGQVKQKEQTIEKQESEIEQLRKENRGLKKMMSSNVRQAFAWILVVVLAIAVSIIYFPLIAQGI